MALPPDDLQAKREAAARAMEGDARQAKRAEENAKLATRRSEAARAMENEEQRHHRESREELARRQAAAVQAKLDAETKQVEAERAAQKATLEAAARREQAAFQAKQKRVGTIERAGRIIETLKSGDLKLTSLRTYKGDMARAVREEGISVSKIAMAGQGRRGARGEVALARRSNLGWLVFLLLLVGGGAAGYYYYYLWPNQTTPRPATIAAPSPIIFSEARAPLDLTSLSGTEAIQQQINTEATRAGLSGGAIKNIYFTRGGQILPFSAFRQAAGLNLPADLSRTVEEEFMFGIYNNSVANNRFLIIEPKLSELAFGAMLDWEPKLLDDIFPLLSGGPPQSNARGQIFIDRLVHNKDARLLKNKAGETILFYAFLDPHHLIISRNEETFLEVLKRFTAGEN